MTIKRVNFTGRRRITRDCVDIAVHDGQPRTFDATIKLEGLSFLSHYSHAAVYLEATCAGSSVIKRFEFGEVGKLQLPTNRTLTDLEGENVFFTLKVVDRTEQYGRILGIAEHIRPQKAGKQTVAGRRGILPIEPVELGQQLWQLEFREHDVFLLVNKSIPGLVDRVRSDPVFYAAIYPEVVRRILSEAIAQNVEIEDEADQWPVLWLRFGTQLHASKQEPPRANDPDDIREEWIESVVDAFCETHALKDKYVVATSGNGGES